MTTIQATHARTQSPWWDHPRVGQLLKRAEAEGATIQNERDYYQEDQTNHRPDFLRVSFGSVARAGVYYAAGDGDFWCLDIDGYELDANLNREQHLNAAACVIQAARLCIALNRDTQSVGAGYDAMADEIRVMLADREMTVRELADAAGIAYGHLAVCMNGNARFGAGDLLAISAALNADDPDELAVRFLGLFK